MTNKIIKRNKFVILTDYKDVRLWEIYETSHKISFRTFSKYVDVKSLFTLLGHDYGKKNVFKSLPFYINYNFYKIKYKNKDCYSLKISYNNDGIDNYWIYVIVL